MVNLRTSRKDNYETPRIALPPLLRHIPRDITIWEPAPGTGRLGNALADAGYRVIMTWEDFFQINPHGWDIIITNPPYSQKFKWIERCYDLGKPWAMIMPLETIGTKRGSELFRKHGITLITLNKRIAYSLPGQGTQDRPAFSSAWFVWYGKKEHNLIMETIE